MAVSGSGLGQPMNNDSVKGAAAFFASFANSAVVPVAGVNVAPSQEMSAVAIYNPSQTWGLLATINGKDKNGAAIVLGTLYVPPSSQQEDSFQSYYRASADQSQMISSVTLNPMQVPTATTTGATAAVAAAATLGASDGFTAIVNFNNE